MDVRRGRLALASLLTCGAIAIFVHRSWSQDPPTRRPQLIAQAAQQGGQTPEAREALALKEFMRKKLAASNQILEGLCTEDLALVKAGALQMQEMSNAERWRVSNDVMYRQFSADFREITQGLADAAEAGNADRVALKWMDATMSCLDCHRFVRGMRVAGAE
jgi:hypothetical protein